MDNTCKKCELSKNSTQVVLYDGNPNAKIMLIGEAPGAEEDKAGVPFVGRAGKFLTKMLEEAGFDRKKDLYITNIVKCRPPENRKPKREEVEACRDYLEAEIASVKPEVIILVGSVALEAFVKEKTTITKARGQIFPHKSGAKLIPIFHPSYLLRKHSEEPHSPRGLTRSDLNKVKNCNFA